MKKINIIGTSGSGKSTLGRKLADLLDVDYIEMDALFWGPNWSETSDEELFAKLEQRLSGEEGWVIDGNYTRTIPIKWKDVDMVIWIDLPFWVNFRQSVQRAVNRAWTKRELWEGTGNREEWRKLISAKSVVWWMMKTHRKNRIRNTQWLRDEKFAHIRFVRLQSRREIDQFLHNLSNK